MQSATFIGAVSQGRLHIGEPLAEFEGKQVLVTLIAPDVPLTPPPASQETGTVGVPRAAEEPELFEDVGRIRTPARAATTLTAEIVATGRRPLRASSGEEE